MSHVILQPASGADAQAHYEDTIVRPVPFAPNRDLLGPHYHALLERFPNGAAAMWGVVPGDGDRGTRLYGRASVGDLVLFSRQNRYFAAGTVTYMWQSQDLARRLWGIDPRGQTWENMYALDDVRGIDVPYAELSQVVGYKPNFIPQGFMVLDEDKSDRVFSALFPRSVVREPEVSTGEFEAAIEALDGNLDQQVMATRRVEQAYLRRMLFGDRPIGTCAICAEQFPTDLLVAAHIKKRASCERAEKRDVANNVMAACAFGCDDLYERGYLTVGDDGRILISPSIHKITSRVGRRLAELAGRRCTAFSEGSRGYFAWHRDHSFRQDPPSTSQSSRDASDRPNRHVLSV